jgi:hypothetical protein
VFLAAAVRLRVVSEEMSGAEVVHTFVATMWPDGVATTAPMPPRAIASWSDAILFGRVAGCRGADLPRLIEEPAEPRTQKRQGPPEGRAMNIRPRAGETLHLTIQSFP